MSESLYQRAQIWWRAFRYHFVPPSIFPATLGATISWAVDQTFNPIMGFTNVWTDIDFYKEKRIHPTQKPLKLIQRLIQASSNQNDIILDPFMGSGTTAVVAKILNRNYIGFEVNKQYIEQSRKRLDNLEFEKKLMKKRDLPLDNFL